LWEGNFLKEVSLPHPPFKNFAKKSSDLSGYAGSINFILKKFPKVF
jgi:hypothetical protein